MKEKAIRKLIVTVSLFIFLLNFTPTYAAQDTIKITINGDYVQFDQPPIIVNNRVLVPLRIIFEELGATVDYNNATRKVTGFKDGTSVNLTLGSKIAYINEKKVTLDVPANAVNGRTLVPARFIAESLGATVDWNNTERTVVINTGIENIPGIVDLIYPANPVKKITNTKIESEIIYAAGKNDEDSIYIRIPANTLNQASTLKVSPNKVSGLDENIIKPLLSYEITILEQNKFNKDLIIEFPYSKTTIDKNFSEKEQLIAAYFNETDKVWESIPYEVDTSSSVIRIKTNHLTKMMIGKTDPNKNKVATNEGVQNALKLANGYSYPPVTPSQEPTEYEVAQYGIDTILNNYPNMTLDSVYKTEHFTINFNIEEEKEMTAMGYTYSKRAFSDSDYPQIEYAKNFYVNYKNRTLNLEQMKIRYRSEADINKVVPVRIKELGMILEETYTNYGKNFIKINSPYEIKVVKEGNASAKKYMDYMTLPLTFMDYPNTIRVLAGHELFHAVQRNYANPLDMVKNKWLMEATAEYAAHKISPTQPLGFDGRNINMEYFRKPLGTVESLIEGKIEDLLDIKKQEHEYKSAKFIDYLVRNKGFKLHEMFELYRSKYIADNFSVLEEYMKTKDPNFILGKAYLDFAGYMMLDQAGDLRDVNIYDQSFKIPFSDNKVSHDISLWGDQAYVPQITASKIDIPEKEKRKVTITAESPELGLGVNVYLLKGNKKASGIKPVLELSKETKKSTLVEVEKGDIIYFVAGNSALNDPNAKNYTMKGKVTIEDSAISLKREYSNITRTTKTVKLTAEGKGLENIANLDFKWTVTSNKGNYINLNDPRTATFSGASMKVNLIHENPIDELDPSDINSGSTNPFGSGDNPFDIIIKNIDDGTEYTINLKIIDKKSGMEIYSTSVKEIVGLKSPMKEGSTDRTEGGTIVLP